MFKTWNAQKVTPGSFHPFVVASFMRWDFSLLQGAPLYSIFYRVKNRRAKAELTHSFIHWFIQSPKTRILHKFVLSLDYNLSSWKDKVSKRLMRKHRTWWRSAAKGWLEFLSVLFFFLSLSHATWRFRVAVFVFHSFIQHDDGIFASQRSQPQQQ